MLPRLLGRSPDLRRLAESGYDLDVVAGHLVVRGIPYVDVHRSVRRGTLVMRLDLAGERTVSPRDHTAWFAGSLPCDGEGRPLVVIMHTGPGRGDRDLGGGLRVDHWICSKPLGREFIDYHEKVVTFVNQISVHASTLDPTATAQPGRVVAAGPNDTPFTYTDTATPRAGIGALTERITGQNVAIVGLGGTGGYVLDFVSKTPVRTIHLFDDDQFLQHNAFRAPGAVARQELAARRLKVEHFDTIYSRLHRGVVAHAVRMEPSRFCLLDGLDFVFVCIDQTEIKRPLVRHLEENGIAFVDVGIGLHHTDRGLTGTVRVTASTPGMRAHVWERNRIPMSGGVDDDPYATNIQVVELNALNAAFAVVRWKRLFGFYADFSHEYFAAYSIDGNHILNEDFRQMT
jgi:hypothetical protein